MKLDFIQADREKLLGQLMAGFKRDEALSLEQLAELEAQLSPSENAISLDTLAVFKMRSLFAMSKYVQSYTALANGLRQMPRSLSLQYERLAFLTSTQNVLSDLLHQDPTNPIVESLYEILKTESALNVWHQVDYLKYLIHNHRYSEAAKIALPLVALHPTLLGLRDQVELIAQKVPYQPLTEFLTKSPPRVGKNFVTIELSNRQANQLREKLYDLRAAIRNDEPIHMLDKYLFEAIGRVDESTQLNTNLKEFYYLRAIVEEKKENYFDSLYMFRSLVEMDPANLNYRNSMETEMRYVCDQFTEQAKKGTLKIDLLHAYSVLKEIGHVPYPLLTQVCLAEVVIGKRDQAKNKMQNLIALNPVDSDYLNSAKKVAEFMEDSHWLSEIQRLMTQALEVRPWDLELRSQLEPCVLEAA